jgi:hypothetical protein
MTYEYLRASILSRVQHGAPCWGRSKLACRSAEADPTFVRLWRPELQLADLFRSIEKAKQRGKPYLCRIVDMLHMGYVDEVLFGKEVAKELPRIVQEWVKLSNQRGKPGLSEA